MSSEEREAWDQRYTTGRYVDHQGPAPFLVEWLPRFPVGRALDVACGTGRNALELAAAGFEVDAVDVSEVAMARARAEATRRGIDVNWVLADLDDHPLPRDGYDLITVIRFRDAELWPRLVAALAPGGWLLVEHHLRTHLEVAGPPGESFRLEPGELLRAFGELRIVHYSEQIEPSDKVAGDYVLARLVACAGDPGW